MYATEVLEGHSQAAFNQMVVRLELEHEIPANTGLSVQKKCTALARIVTGQPDAQLDTLEGCMSLGEAVVREAIAVVRQESRWTPEAKFVQALAKDGYSLVWNADGEAVLTRIIPEVVESVTIGA